MSEGYFLEVEITTINGHGKIHVFKRLSNGRYDSLCEKMLSREIPPLTTGKAETVIKYLNSETPCFCSDCFEEISEETFQRLKDKVYYQLL